MESSQTSTSRSTGVSIASSFLGQRSAALRRLESDLREIQNDPTLSHQVSIGPVENNPYTWSGFLMGPEGTPYENGCFRFTIDFPINYPFDPPKIRFQSRMFHPNIRSFQHRVYPNNATAVGSLILKILETPNWSTCMSVHSIINVILMCLYEPEIITHDYSETANPLAARLYFEDRDLYDSKVRQTVEASYDDGLQTSTSRVVENEETARVELVQELAESVSLPSSPRSENIM